MNNNISLKEFFDLTEIKLNEKQLTIPSSEQAVQGVRAALTKFSGLSWETVGDSASKALANTFTMSLGDVMAKAWGQYTELRKYMEKPEVINYLRLAKHVVVSEHAPEVEVVYQGVSLAKFKFKAKFELELYGASLMIHERKIKKLMGVSGKGVCKFSHGPYEFFKKESKTIDLLGEVTFDPGIALNFFDKESRVTQPVVTV